VLRIPERSERVVTTGTPLLELGDPTQLEIVSDLLSEDAVKVKPGDRVLVEDWGDDHPLEGHVRLIELSGFTKVSALGVETAMRVVRPSTSRTATRSKPRSPVGSRQARS